ncbi:MAG: type II toxin-antitoxin system VapC family toxin [Bacteroidetes bacterium]|nr:type II toxin-antitoxin system VapC family toxin [Bacteroidota bacterium]
MDKYLLDTNIILHYLRKNKTSEKIESELYLLDDEVVKIISVVTIAELRCFAMSLNWGNEKTNNLSSLLKRLVTISINSTDKDLMDAYATLQSYSKNKLHGNPLGRSVGIGQNDIWIAATALVTDSILVTTDSDFDHLHPEFINLRKF